ncbi:SDR family oxidoreductase [Paracidobacterium acidisoli]|uniref:SDR family oxidoreductase n=1 Tax=Paracidobacterium acidisoli TaxID=2303751 RepID=A0A372ILM2_9BACT|nr:SDR family oxidoreductase [Paracidobacterium acidisoli]MBT9332382.1 SDR family oxidoreductase [Paracidobacterium acidisoli]
MSSSENYTPPNEMPPASIHRVLTGQKALVTGGSKGLGKDIAIGLAKAGADVLVNYNSDEEGARLTVAEIHALGAKAIAFRADVSKEDEVLAMFSAMMETFGRLDICIPNSALQLNAHVDEMTLAQWERVIGVNLTGVFLCCREAVRIFKRQGIDRSISYACGKLLLVSSVHDIIPWAGHSNYAAAKGGLMLFMKSLAQEVAHLRIRVNAISPGAIRTPMNVEKLTSPEVFESALLKLIPSKRIGEPEDVSRAVVWLVSDESDYVHGTTLYIDGGMTLYPGFIDAG